MTRTRPLRDLRTVNPASRIDALVAQGLEQAVQQSGNSTASAMLDFLRPMVHQQLRRTIGPRALPDLHKALKQSDQHKEGATNHQSKRSTTGQSEHAGNCGAARDSGGMTRADALKVLGLQDGTVDGRPGSPQAFHAVSQEEIKTAYRAIAPLYHPDLFASKPPELKRFAEKKMVELNAAYQFLKGTQ